MSKNIGHVGLVALLLLTLIVPLFSQTTYAQEDDNQVVIAGSTYLEELLRVLTQNYVDATGSEIDFVFQAEGLTSGFESLCVGNTDLMMSTRPINDEELLNCDTDFVEILLAIEGLVLVPDVGISADLQCTTSDNLPNIIGIGASEQLTWLDVSPFSVSPDELTLYGPEADIATFLASLLPSEQARDDYETFATLNDILDQLQTPGSNTLAFTTLKEWSALTEEERGDVNPLDITVDDFETCITPTIENVEAGEYALGRRLMLYVNANSLEQVTSFLNFALDEAGISSATDELGFSTPTVASLDRGLQNLERRNIGRTFSRPDSPVETNTAEQGSIAIRGSSVASYRTDIAYEAFNTEYTAISLNVTPLGNADGWQAFCSGDVGVLQVTRQATEEEAALCESNNINPTEVFLGSDAVVLVVANEEVPTCVSYDDIRTLIVNDNVDVDKGMLDETEASDDGSAEESEDAEGPSDTPEQSAPQGPTDWSEFGAEVPLLILPPELGSLENDLIFSTIAPGEFLIRRTDAPTVQEVPEDTDLEGLDYRLGAVPNFDGGALTWAFWSDVQAREIEGLRLLEVGPDCVAPSAETITNGIYPISVSSYLVFSDDALGDAYAGALLWDLLSDDTVADLLDSDVIGLDRDALEVLRESLFSIIAEAQAERIATEAETPETTEQETEGSEGSVDDPSVNPDGTINEDAESTPEAETSDEETTGSSEESAEEGETPPDSGLPPIGE